MRHIIYTRITKLLQSFVINSDATAAVEAAIFAPIFLTLMLGVTDLGSGMFVRTTVNAAAQAGAAYAVANSCTASCLSNIQTAMNDAAGGSTFCTVGTCAASTRSPCSAAEPSTTCVIVSANYPFSPILPVTSGSFSQSWTKSTTLLSTVTIRIQ